MVRVAPKPYTRPEPHRRSNPDSPGSWKHDLHENVKQSLASRISSASSLSSSSRPSLLARISGSRGQELLPSSVASSSSPRLHGFDVPPPSNAATNPNAGLELLPPGPPPRAAKKSGPGSVLDSRVVASGLSAAGLGGGYERVQRVSQVRPVGRELMAERVEVGPASGPGVASVSIFGAAKTTLLVRVENLAPGTTPDDVMSAFAPSPILSAVLAPSTSSLVAVDLEYATRQPGEELIAMYNGVTADGNTLKVGFARTGLSERIGKAQVQAEAGESGSGLSARMGHRPGNSNGTGAAASSSSRAGAETKGQSLGQRSSAGKNGGSGVKELLPVQPPGKMYSDTILASNPTSGIITLAEADVEMPSSPSTVPRSQRADAWLRGGPSAGSSLAMRVGEGRRGRGQIGGGSYADMMVD